MPGEAKPAEHSIVVASSGSFAALLSISKRWALKWEGKTEGADMQLSRQLATWEAEWSEFRLTRSRASTQYVAYSAGIIPGFLLDVSINFEQQTNYEETMCNALFIR